MAELVDSTVAADFVVAGISMVVDLGAAVSVAVDSMTGSEAVSSLASRLRTRHTRTTTTRIITPRPRITTPRPIIPRL